MRIHSYAIIVVACLCANVTSAKWENVSQLWPKDMPQSTKEWFSKQKNSTGSFCCSVADGIPTDWDLKDGHYRVLDTVSLAHPVWRDVPDGAMIRNETNPTGTAVVWYMPSKDSEGLRGIRCFIAGSEN